MRCFQPGALPAACCAPLLLLMVVVVMAVAMAPRGRVLQTAAASAAVCSPGPACQWLHVRAAVVAAGQRWLPLH